MFRAQNSILISIVAYKGSNYCSIYEWARENKMKFTKKGFERKNFRIAFGRKNLIDLKYYKLSYYNNR